MMSSLATRISILTQRMAICVDHSTPTKATESSNYIDLCIADSVALVGDSADNHPLIARSFMATHMVPRVQPPLGNLMRDATIERPHIPLS